MSRNISHWSARYLLHRVLDKAYQRIYPDKPWLTPQANRILEKTLQPDFQGLEFGSGRSTLWFAARMEKLTSVEHNPEWYHRVKDMLAVRGISNVEYLLTPETEMENGEPAYVQVADRFSDESLDLILVDGILRDACVLRGLSKLKPGGLLVIDDAQRYLPSDSTAPYARTPGQGPVSEGWCQFMEKTTAWPRIWTQNGVSDTVLYTRP